jgi:cell shape-determining protein MreD
MISVFERLSNSWQEFADQALLETVLFTPIFLLLLLVREFVSSASSIESDNFQSD